MDPQRPTSGDLLKPWKELSQQIGKDQSRLHLISVVVAGWLAKKDRGQSGVLVVGKIQRLQRGKDLLIAWLEVPDNSKTRVTVVSAAKDAPGTMSSYREGSRVLVAGTILDDPSAKLDGYFGDPIQVVWSGYVLELTQPTDL